MSSLENRNLISIAALPSPEDVKRAHPISAQAAELVLGARAAIRDVIHGSDVRRRVAIVGPCSLHDPEAALEYAERLLPVAKALRDDVIVLMRTYFEKPRTTVGWKGLVNDPHLDGSCDIEEGLIRARKLLMAIHEIGLPCATEFLDPISPQYLADAVSWAAIGARTTESQTHREMASGLSMPVGFKNATNGDTGVAIDATISAAHPHSFLGVLDDGTAAVVKTKGNADTHIVLRGGHAGTNFDAESVAAVSEKLTGRSVMIDCSHANSGKQAARQALALRDVAGQIRSGDSAILGVMLESNLVAGRQNGESDTPLRYGVSITDECIGFEETEALLHSLASAIRPAKTKPAAMGFATAS
ncbi:MAG: 3-deoxy-7-phosphoheptulonate synthase [Myxococcota bacterium]